MDAAESKYGIPNIKRFSRKCFYMGLCIGILACILIILLWLTDSNLRKLVPPCSFHSVTGFYCPGCGGTRAVHALLHGRILESLRYHPFVLYFAVGYVVYMLSHLLDIMSKGRVKGLSFCPYYWYVAVGLLLGQWVLKNCFLLFGVDFSNFSI